MALRAKTVFPLACAMLVASLAAVVAAGDSGSPDQSGPRRDSVVLRTVFDDMLSKDDSESPPEWHGDQSKPVYVSKNAPRQVPTVREILSHNDKKKWKALTDAQLQAASEGACDLVARAGKGESLPELGSTSGRVKIWEDAGAATQPSATQPTRFWERASDVYLPGYSKDGRYAVVNLEFPWSIHSGVVTYILERTDDGWKVVLRDFIYFV
jgi:hypothetical protein